MALSAGFDTGLAVTAFEEFDERRTGDLDQQGKGLFGVDQTPLAFVQQCDPLKNLSPDHSG